MNKRNAINALGDILNTKDFRSPDVEDFIFNLDPNEINDFKSHFIKQGVLTKRRLNLLTKYFKNFLDIEFLDQVISSTEEAFETVEDYIKYPSHEEYFGEKIKAQIMEAKNIISNKEVIFKKLKGLKTRIEKYQQEL
jgi:hypothetical protein